MKYLFSFFISLLFVSFLSAQDKNVNTYAVIIGIANYENENINLNYANRDAQVFADYLQSKAGGSVPADNIRLLIDTNATTAAIYNSLTWLRDRCELNKIENSDQPSLVYFYFSGHGDVETDTKANLGFLLSFNTPPNNYINNAVRIEDLNNYAHTLSVDLNAHVVIITDACHSGKLAGSDNKGSFLVGKELSAAKEKEIRIASCNPNELSNEDERWGGGRGVFSYYLINGLKGFADRNRDSTVTLSEIKSYVDSSIAADPILKVGKLKQTPVLEGNLQFKLSQVDKEELVAMNRSFVAQQALQSDQDYYFNLLKDENWLEDLDYDQMIGMDKDEIPFSFILRVRIDPTLGADITRVNKLQAELRTNSAKLKLFNEKLVELFHTTGQKIINLCLEGDAAELERGRYYNSRHSSYDVYPKIYALALKLIQPDNPLSHILKVNQFYFKGVAARLKIPFTEEAQQDSLIGLALALQMQALALDDNAAYVHNELGILYKFKKDYLLAEKYFTNATMLSSSWAIPWANLCGLHADMKEIDKSIADGQTAESLQPDLQLTSSSLGLAYERSGNLLFAEEYYRKAIDINSRHYFPFERLGYVYMNTTQYALADSFLYEADLRKRGYHFKGNAWSEVSIPAGFPYFPEVACNMDTSKLLKDDVMGFFNWGMIFYLDSDYVNAVRIWKKIIAIDKRNPLVFHYIGKVYYHWGNWEGAELMFRFATEYWLNKNQFKRYADSLIRNKKYPYDHTCFEDLFRRKQYDREDDYYFLATLYESWGHYEEAEVWYRKIISFDPAFMGGYIKLWQMMEKQGRYTDAEKIIQSYTRYDKERAERELNSFYRRTLHTFPENGDWNYRLGMLLYERSPIRSRQLYLDSIIYFPKENKEFFIDQSTYSDLKDDKLSWDINIAGSPKKIIWKTFLERPADLLLPGILAHVQLAEPIYTPRRDAITYLSRAEELLPEPEAKADLNFKIGNVFVWAGSKKQAYPYYVKSVDLTPGNASARLNLVDVCKAIYKNRKGLEQLVYLYDNGQINFPKKLLYAEYSIHSADFGKAGTLLQEAEAIYPYKLPEIFDLKGRLSLLNNQPADAIPFYKQYLASYPDNAATLYTLAKLYNRSGNENESWRYLEEAMKKGFNYAYVLNSDAVWESFRKNSKWAGLLKKFPLKKYIYPDMAVN